MTTQKEMRMTNYLSSIISLFSDNYSLTVQKEDCDSYTCTYRFILSKNIDYLQLKKVLSSFNSRDNICISTMQEGEVFHKITNLSDEKLKEFSERLNDQVYKGEEIDLKYEISKHNADNKVSVYDFNLFLQYIRQLDLRAFLHVLNKRLNDNLLLFECQNEENINVYTKTIGFISKGSKIRLDGLESTFRSTQISKTHKLCHWSEKDISLLPEDLFICKDNNYSEKLSETFHRNCLLYTSMFLFDYTSLTQEKYEYKLNGFKTFWKKFNTKEINSSQLSYESDSLFYDIYSWCYKGGNTSDKLSIARNIISLNFIPETLFINKETIDSIKSNFKIYERENVRQYIEVRNKLSEILIDLQSKIGNIVDSFSNDFKKNIFTLLSFFLSVVVIQVVSSGNFIKGFTNEILILSFSFLFISIIYLLFSRWEFTKKERIFKKHYLQLKNRYKDLLSPQELESIFEDCDPLKDDSNSNFVEKQKKRYTILWSISIFILFLALLIIGTINNIEIFNCIYNFLKSIIICCTKNI
jgi:hypothetical protein